MENKERDDNQVEDYSVYNYLYNHPSIVLAILTALATVFSFIAKLLYQTIELHYLEYWGFPTGHFNYSIGNDYSFALGLIAYIAFLPIYAWYTFSLTVFHNNNFFAKSIDYEYRIIKKEIKREISCNKKKNKCKEKEEGVIERCNNIKMKRKIIKKGLRNMFLPQFFISLFVIWMIISFYLSLVTVQANLALWFYVLLLIAVAAYLLIILVVSYTFNCPTYRRIKKDAIESKGFDDQDAELSRYHLRPYSDYKIHEFFSNRKIKSTVISIVISFAFFISLFVILVDRGYNSQKTFQIVNLDENIYAVIFRDTDLYYLNEANVDGDVIRISNQSHLIIQSESVPFLSKRFSSVEKVGESDNSSLGIDVLLQK